jgi:cephalosporin-C deacetylase-like acetyl esterase
MFHPKWIEEATDMTSRRAFLETTSAAFASLVPEISSAKALSEDTAGTQNQMRRDYWNDLPDHMIRKVTEARSKRKAQLASLKSRAQADRRTAMVREKVWELIGGKLPETPLNPTKTGTVEREAYRIEKIVFESQPEFYVPAHLYLPKSANGPFPGILAPLGHAPEGKAYRSYQTLFQNLARQGFAVLTWDPPGQGERLQYIDSATNGSLYGPTGEHDRFGWPALLIGSTTTQFEVRDGIRALDYMLSRPEIDSTRIGCCGHSGGGTQTMFLCALEPRIHAAVVVEGNTENLAGADYSPPGAFADAEQNLIGSLEIPLDRGDLLAAFAPKPLLICYTPVDLGTTYSPHYIAGTEEIFNELKAMYGLYDAGEKVALSHSTLPHDYDYFQRRSTYDWFHKWFRNGSAAPEEVEFEESPESALRCTTTGQVLTSMGGRAVFQVNYDRLRVIKQNAKGDLADKQQVRKQIRQVLHLPSETAECKARSLSTNQLRNLTIEEFEYRSEANIRVPGWFVKPSSGAVKLPVAVLVQDQGKDSLFDHWPLIQDCARAGISVCSLDLRTCGVTRPRLPSEGPAFYGYGVDVAYALVNLSLGTPIIGQQTWDLVRCLDYLESRSDVDLKRVGLCGTGTAGIACLAGAVLEDRFGSLLLYRTLADLECIVASKSYDLPLSAVAFGMLKNFDLPDLCTHVAPRPLWLINSLGPQGTEVPLSDLQQRYGSLRQVYRTEKQSERFVFQIRPGSLDDLVLEWARSTLV